MEFLTFPIKAALFGSVALLCWLAPTATYARQGKGCIEIACHQSPVFRSESASTVSSR